MENKRDVQTLLLCKVNAYHVRNDKEKKGYIDPYSSIFPNKNTKASFCRKYITYGNFDAVSIYRTVDNPSASWLKDVEHDRREITEHISSKICYHPIHMISHITTDDFWKRSESFSACVITLVYGTMQPDQQQVSVDRFVKGCIGAVDETKAIYSVYQAINICDAVVLWLTNDISYALRKSAELIRMGKARKTYSLVGFEMPEFSNLKASKEKLDNKLIDGSFNIRIQGSIRDHVLAAALFSNNESSFIHQCSPTGIRSTEKVEYVCVFGNEDFDIRLQNISKTYLLNLLFGMIWRSEEIANACWDIHTEFIDPEDYISNAHIKKRPTHELDECLGDFIEFYDQLKSSGGPYRWTSAYLELLGTHVNIDHHPILSAPASLFSNFVRIANDYFHKSCDPSFIHQIEYQKIVKKSEERIFSVIRNWSHLTDQLTRTDDLVFHGIGRSPAIYDTIPETILLFYHRFLRKTIDELIATDANMKLKMPGWEYEYDFLLVPEQSQRPRISKMFLLRDYHDYLLNNEIVCQCEPKQACNDCVRKETCERRCLWPDKQVYLVEFQASLLYDPLGFLFPIVHECFHFFGDTFRQREERAKLFASIIATEILFKLNMEWAWYKDFKFRLIDHIAIAQPIGLNLDRTKNQIYDNLKELFTKNKLEQIAGTLDDPFYLQGNELLSKWVSFRTTENMEEVQQDKWGCILDKWDYYFRECFADLMTLLFFDFPIKEYFHFVNDEWRNTGLEECEETEDKSWQFIQRIALVVSAYTFENRHLARAEEQYTEKELRSNCLFDIIESQPPRTFLEINKSNIEGVIVSLLAIESKSSFKTRFNDPPAKLAPVLDYLFLVKETFHKVYDDKLNDPNSVISILRKDYKTFFVEGKLFDDEYNIFLSN